MELNNPKLEKLKSELVNEIRNCVSIGREEIMKMDICTHDANDLNTIFEKIIKENKENANKTFEYVKKQTKIIKQNVSKILLLLVKVVNGKIGNQICSWKRNCFLPSFHMELVDI